MTNYIHNSLNTTLKLYIDQQQKMDHSIVNENFVRNIY